MRDRLGRLQGLRVASGDVLHSRVALLSFALVKMGADVMLSARRR
jgi:aspartate carbamoyltransferase catalytic subunit